MGDCDVEKYGTYQSDRVGRSDQNDMKSESVTEDNPSGVARLPNFKRLVVIERDPPVRSTGP